MTTYFDPRPPISEPVNGGLAVRRACLRRRALCASPGPSLIRQEKAFTHRAHSARPLRPEPELIPSRRGKTVFFSSFSNGFPSRFQGQNWRPKSTKIELESSQRAFRDALGARFSGGTAFLSIGGSFRTPRNLENRAPATMRPQFRLF